ncbi:ABC transporter substrate-binding protein [Pseudoroseicyclus tamaricis]|uniref:Extracellular solute-binding protein n=1 Tax=Pseudoroseicyclus tamaricis TaxID=2705421 RepID=A0A6B2K075_9RHOB|nr:extracellular solute-binding protein [Pseudoroseicyclus tamaricis]NDV01072.1 extracellular solute-binding protein [Pseudoroseicyclus tamaricis]
MTRMTTVALAALIAGSAAEAQDLRILSAVTGGKDAEEQEFFVAELEEHLGLDIEMIKPAADYNNVLFTSLASGEQFDLIYGDSSMLPTLVDQGAIMQLNDIIESSAVLSDPAVIPDGEWDLFDMDGALYGVPNKFEGGTMPIARGDWMDAWGMEPPATIEEWEAYFDRAQEEYGAYGISSAGLYDIQGWMSGWGLKAGYVVDDAGNRTIPYASDDAAAAWDWFCELTEKGQLDPNFASNGSGEFRNLFMADQAAAVGYWDAWVGLFNNLMAEQNPEFRAMGVAGAEGPNGEVILRRGNASLWMIPANAQNVENAVAFLEFWHSQPGYLMGTLGIEGHDYNVENGEYVLTEIGQAHGMDHGAPRVASTTWENPFGALPGVNEAEEIVIEYATTEYQPLDWVDAQPIVEGYAYQAMACEITGEEAVQRMQDDLTAAGLIDG